LKTDMGSTPIIDEMRETPYGIKKRLQFIYREVAQRLNNLGDISKIRTLDIGCGTGELITIPLGSLGLPILGIDTHLPSIEYARVKNPFENVQFEHMSIEELADQQFDFIICSEVLEHLSMPADMLKLIKKCLIDGGTCIITIPNGYSLKEIELRIYKTVRNLGLTFLTKYLRKPACLKDTLSEESPHVQFFSITKFEDLLAECGLSVIKKENRRFLDGFLVNRIFSTSKSLINWNVSVADKIPYNLASNWMFAVENSRSKPGQEE